MTVTVAVYTIYAYVEDYNTCSGIFNKQVNAGTGTDYTRTRRLEGWHLSKKHSTFPRKTPKYLLINERTRQLLWHYR